MKLGLNRYRLVVLGGICLLVLLFAAMVTNLLSQLRELSRAADDNVQWSISQIDTEFANLDATLTQQIARGSFSDEEVQLRVDIALSRLNIINSGRAAEIFAESSESAALIAPINEFARDAIALSDAPGPLAGSRLVDMQQLVSEVRPHVRDIALLGVRLGAEQSEARRAEFANQLSRTGGIAVALLVLMAMLMLLLDRLLQRASRRDAALSASSKKLASTVEASLDGIVTADEKGRITGFNAAAERIFGWSRAEIIGRTMEDTFIPHRMRDAHHNGMKRYLETGQPRVVDAGRVELAALRKSGEEFPVELNITTAQMGDQTTFIAYIRDISARKINEQKLIDARDRAERTDKAKSQFLTVMSHEMRTPLNGILGVLDMLTTTPLNPQQKRYAKIATSSSEILLEHVNEALDITRIETGELQLTEQDFDLSALVHGLMDVFEPLAREKNLTIALEFPPAMLGTYHADAGRIRQILTNLIGNAIKFTEQGGITLRVSGIHGQDGSSLRIEVADTGIGIPPTQQENVFEDFFALAHSEGRQARGDGLGLAISRRIARAMDGDVTVKSKPNQGSTFTLTLPVLRTEKTAEPEATSADVDTPAISPCSILIVEDNTINRSVLSDMLIAMGHHVQEAVDGVDCLDKEKRADFDIIFMDIGMPVMDGIEATRRLRIEGRNARTHIVGLTAHGREEYREQAIAAGMDRFHTKPIRLDALHGIIAEVTSRQLTKLDATRFPQAIVEMIDVLGPGKVRDVADAFLSELASLVADLHEGDDDDSSTLPLEETVHKVKGAAALLGMSDVETELGALEREARSGPVPGRGQWADRLDTRAKESQAILDAALAQASNTAF